MECYYYEYWGVFRPEEPPEPVFVEGGGGESWHDPHYADIFASLHTPEDGWREISPGHLVQDVWTRFPESDYEMIAHPMMQPTGQDVTYEYLVWQHRETGDIYIRRLTYPARPHTYIGRTEMLLRVEDVGELAWLMADDAAGKFLAHKAEGMELHPVTHAEKYDIPDELLDAFEDLITGYEED